MSLRSAALAAACLLVASRAAAETEVALLGGYGREVHALKRAAETGYGIGVGARAGTTLRSKLWLGGLLVTHFGSIERAQDRIGASSYLAYRHVSYLGPEIGWNLEVRGIVVRPYAGAGALVSFGYAAVRERALRDDRASPFLMPGVSIAYRLEPWRPGIDFHVPFATAFRVNEAAPAIFLSVGIVP